MTFPLEGAVMVDKIDRSVDLPAPFGPKRPMTSPLSTFSETFANDRFFPYVLLTLLISIISCPHIPHYFKRAQTYTCNGNSYLFPNERKRQCMLIQKQMLRKPLTYSFNRLEKALLPRKSSPYYTESCDHNNADHIIRSNSLAFTCKPRAKSNAHNHIDTHIQQHAVRLYSIKPFK